MQCGDVDTRTACQYRTVSSSDEEICTVGTGTNQDIARKKKFGVAPIWRLRYLPTNLKNSTKTKLIIYQLNVPP